MHAWCCYLIGAISWAPDVWWREGWVRVLLSISKLTERRQTGSSSSSSTRGKAEESIRKLPSKQSVPEFLLSANPLERESLWTEKPTNALHSTQQQHRRSSLSRRSLQANRQTTWNTPVNATLCLLFCGPPFVSFSTWCADLSFFFFFKPFLKWSSSLKHFYLMATKHVWYLICPLQMSDICGKYILKNDKKRGENNTMKFCAVYLRWLYLKTFSWWCNWRLQHSLVCVRVCVRVTMCQIQAIGETHMKKVICEEGAVGVNLKVTWKCIIQYICFNLLWSTVVVRVWMCIYMGTLF